MRGKNSNLPHQGAALLALTNLLTKTISRLQQPHGLVDKTLDDPIFFKKYLFSDDTELDTQEGKEALTCAFITHTKKLDALLNICSLNKILLSTQAPFVPLYDYEDNLLKAESDILKHLLNPYDELPPP